MNKVQIISGEEEFVKAGKSVRIDKTRCFVNNVEIPMVISADFHASVDEVPEFKFKVVGRPDIETYGRVTFTFFTRELVRCLPDHFRGAEKSTVISIRHLWTAY